MKWLLVVFFFLAPFTAFASFHNYTCADGLTPAGAASGCTSTGSYNFPGGPSSYTDNTPVYTLTPGTTYYVTYTSNNGGQNDATHAFQFNSTGSVTYVFVQSGTNSEVSSGSSGGASPGGIIIRYDDAAVISGLCIDDDGTSCTAGPAVATSILGLVNAFWIF